MKKSIFICLGIAVLIMLFSSFSTFKSGTPQMYVSVKTIYEDGHKYVVAYSGVTNTSSRPSGVSIVHSEACTCKRHK